jgi:hypothetical protein
MPGLSYEQGDGIVSRLKHNKQYALLVTCDSADSNAVSYAAELTQAVREGGWEVSGPCAPAGCAAVPEVFLGIDDPASPHPSARLLLDVLTAVGIRVELTKAKNVGPGGCCLIVGRRSAIG